MRRILLGGVAALVACGGTKSEDDSAAGGGAVVLADAYTLDGDDLFPEGVAWHDDVQAFFYGSLTTGIIVRLDPDGTQTVVHTLDGPWMTLGMKVDGATGDLLVCAVENYGTDTPHSELWVYSPGASEVRTVALEGDVVCNDVAVTSTGRVFLTEREGPRLHEVDRAAGTASVFLEDPALAPEIIGLNGIVVKDDEYLLVGKYAPGRLLKVPLDGPEGFTEVVVGGAGMGALPDGPDGIAWMGDELVIAANSTVLRVASTDDWATATSTASTPPAAVAAVTVAQGEVYGLKGEIVPYVLGTEISRPFELLRLTVD